jgi:glycosyltransferase involved in cell wall biosynthesis
LRKTDFINRMIFKSRNPLITIVTPSFNQGQFIEDTILSVLNQTYKNIQYIVVDGGSTDCSLEVINRYSHRIDLIISEKDNGQTDAINKGFKLSKGELVGWINSDDLLYPDCVEKIVELYQKNNDGVIFYGSYNDKIDKNGNKLITYQKVIPNRNYLLNSNYDVIQPASFYRADIVKKINYLNDSINYCMDLDLWLRLLKYGLIYAFNEKPLSAFRVWEETKTKKGRSNFLREIRKTLLKNGANRLSKNIRKTVWHEIKDFVKRSIKYEE